MIRRSRIGERLVALFLLGLLVLLPPVLLVFNRPVRVLGVPVLYLYIFVAWGLLIVLAAVLAERLVREEDISGQRTGPVEGVEESTDKLARDA